MDILGLDLSKNHYGLCHIEQSGKINFQYVWFKPYLKRDKATTTYTLVEERFVDQPKHSYRQLCYKYDDQKFNTIYVDAFKSDLFIESLKAYLNILSGSRFISLEDYVMGDRIIQLVHVTESLKYHIAKTYSKKETTLFLCPNVTWKKFFSHGVSLKSPDPKKPYLKIDEVMKQFYPSEKTFIDSLIVSWDIYKDLIDSFGLANAAKADSLVFRSQYQKRIFTF